MVPLVGGVLVLNADSCSIISAPMRQLGVMEEGTSLFALSVCTEPSRLCVPSDKHGSMNPERVGRGENVSLPEFSMLVCS